MLRWIVGSVFVALMTVGWYLIRVTVDNFGIAGAAIWILACFAMGFWI
jgi:hypothetical protein